MEHWMICSMKRMKLIKTTKRKTTHGISIRRVGIWSTGDGAVKKGTRRKNKTSKSAGKTDNAVKK